MKITRDLLASGLVNPDRIVRNCIVSLLEDREDPGIDVTKNAIAAIERWGLREAFNFPHQICGFRHNEETLDWALEQLSGLIEAGNNLSRHFSGWIAAAPVEILEPRFNRLARILADTGSDLPASKESRNSGNKFLARARKRIELASLSLEETRQELDQALIDCADAPEDSFPHRPLSVALECCERLAREPGPLLSGLVSEWLAFDFESAYDIGHWRAGVAVHLAGILRLTETFPRLLEMFEYDWEWWNEEIETATKRMADIEVLESIAEAFPAQPWHARLYLAGALEDTFVPGMDEPIYRILDSDRDNDMILRLGLALARYGSQKSMEKAEQICREFPDDPDRVEILETLVSYAVLSGSEHPSIRDFRQQLAAAEEPGKPADLPQPAPARLAKVGRNDPCPCGSGKKYKKCCLDADEARVREAAAARSPLPFTSTPKPNPPARESIESPGTIEPFPAPAPAEEDLPEIASENDITPEVASRFAAIWRRFDAIETPSAEQMDDLLSQLLELPPDAVDWAETFRLFARLKHPEPAELFRRIAASVVHTADTKMEYFYWIAAESFLRNGSFDLLPEVAAGFQRLDAVTYDIDVLNHVMDLLLVGGADTAALRLTEHFLPIVRDDDNVLEGGAEELADIVYALRIGKTICEGRETDEPVESLAAELRRDIEDEITHDMALHAAGILSGRTSTPEPTRPSFELVKGCITEDEQAWENCKRLYGALIGVARETWKIDQRPPGSAFQALHLTLLSIYASKQRRKKKSKKPQDNLLDFLLPAGLEGRIVEVSRDLFGVKFGRASLLFDGYEILTRYASRHRLIALADAAAMDRELDRLRRALRGLD